MPEIDQDDIYTFEFTPIREKYYSEETSWGVYSISTDVEVPHSVYTSRNILRDDFSIDTVFYFESVLSGKLQRLTLGTKYIAKAKVVYSSKYKSYNFLPVSITQDIPKTLDDQRAYLISIITKNQADTLLKVYPNIVDDVINGKEINLKLTKGIKEHTWEIIKNKILENYAFSDIISFLAPLGITIARIRTLLKNEPNTVLLKEMLLKNPYIIVEIDGVTFKQADAIAIKLNPSLLVSKERTIAFIKSHLYKLSFDEGNTYVSYKDLNLAIQENIIECEDIFFDVMDEEKGDDSFLFIEDEKIGLRSLRVMEEYIWGKLIKVNNSEPLYVSDEAIEKGIKLSQEQQGFDFTDEQLQIIKESTKNNFIMIIGKAGTGKTTIARALLNIYSFAEYQIGACALSAKAAVRITEVTGHQASTIHKLLGAKGISTFVFNENLNLPHSVIFVDESSMINISLFFHLLKATKPNVKIILSGDDGQLPPIGAGNTFSDFLNKSDIFQVKYLKKIMRQALDSGIIVDSNMIREGNDPLNGKYESRIERGNNKDMFYMFRNNRDTINKIVINTFMKSVEEVGLDNVSILSPRKNSVLNSTKEFNKVIQDILIPDHVPFMKFGDSVYRQGAKVIHTVNNYEKQIFNGETGYIVSVENPSNEGGTKMLVNYGDKTIEYRRADLKELELAYALTIHKFQGSETHTIIIALDNTSYALLDSCLLYTGITRAKERCLLISEPFAYKRAIEGNKTNSRATWTKSFTV